MILRILIITLMESMIIEVIVGVALLTSESGHELTLLASLSLSTLAFMRGLVIHIPGGLSKPDIRTWKRRLFSQRLLVRFQPMVSSRNIQWFQIAGLIVPYIIFCTRYNPIS